MNKILALILILIIFQGNSLAEIQNPDIIKDCILTPQLWALESPKSFLTSSDLRKKTGSSIFLSGQNIIISGSVLDDHCVPLTSARVNIWQKNPDKKSSLNHGMEYINGSIITDNLGNFEFYTLMPEHEKDSKPFVFFHISHHDILDFETRMFFSSDLEHEKSLEELSSTERKSLVATCLNCKDHDPVDQYYFQIIVPGKSHYKEY